MDDGSNDTADCDNASDGDEFIVCSFARHVCTAGYRLGRYAF